MEHRHKCTRCAGSMACFCGSPVRDGYVCVFCLGAAARGGDFRAEVFRAAARHLGEAEGDVAAAVTGGIENSVWFDAVQVVRQITVELEKEARS